MNDNKLIAEFMGRGGTFNHDKTMICTGIYPDTMTLMKYHTSWDWLMPMVEKIDAMFGEDDVADDAINRVHNAVLAFDIDNTHRAVVEFIKEYNENKRLNMEYESFNDAPYGDDN